MDKNHSITAYYGSMYAFVKTFKGEMAAVQDIAPQLEGRDPLREFGWQTALDRARGRAQLILDRWFRLNEVFASGFRIDSLERRIFGKNPISVKKGAGTARQLRRELRGFNEYIEGIKTYRTEDVRKICCMARKFAIIIEEEEKASALVAAYLDREPSVSGYFEIFSRMGDEFRARLEQGD